MHLITSATWQLQHFSFALSSCPKCQTESSQSQSQARDISHSPISHSCLLPNSASYRSYSAYLQWVRCHFLPQSYWTHLPRAQNSCWPQLSHSRIYWGVASPYRHSDYTWSVDHVDKVIEERSEKDLLYRRSSPFEAHHVGVGECEHYLYLAVEKNSCCFLVQSWNFFVVMREDVKVLLKRGF
jgi:hypothetical protein